MSGDGSLRRTRSTGDVPIATSQPHGRVQILSSSRHSDSNRTLPFIDEMQNVNLLTVPAAQPSRQQNTGSESGLVETPPSELPEDAQVQAIAQQTVPATAHDQRDRLPPRTHNRSFYSRTIAFLGFGRDASRARRSLVSLLSNLGWGFVQVVVIVSLLVVSGHRESPTSPGLNEWKACDRPLGAWASLWIVRVALACGLTYWGWLRDRRARSIIADFENTHATLSDAITAAAGQPSQTTFPGQTPATATSATRPARTGLNHATSTPPEPVPLPYARLYSRLSLFSSLLTFSWFWTAQIFQYMSVHTCRLSSPHLWWLTFGILCIMYLMVLEVVLLGFVVFVIAPILFLFWNIFLICIGRHPIQNPTMIKPEVGKLPKSVVDRIPLVMYIPPPPETPTPSPITIPEAIYSYPPKTQKVPPATPKRRFKFLRGKSSSSEKKDSGESTSAVVDENGPEGTSRGKYREPQTWEEHWEQGDYPFVRLEGNRAACAICLMDFEEPKKIAGMESHAPKKPDEGGPSRVADTATSGIESGLGQVPVENSTQDREKELRLLDAGEGAQPLRLLTCGHVFHRICLDPWLTDVSGRCPVCQQPVKVPEPSKKNRRQHS